MLKFSDSIMATLLAPIAQRELNKAYGHLAPAWRFLTRRTDRTHFGRKRRARRARGRRIENRRPYSSAALAMASLWGASTGLRSKPIGPTTRLGNVEIATCIVDPSMGNPWGDGTPSHSPLRDGIK